MSGREWRPTHLADGVPVMLCPEDVWTEDDVAADDDPPRRFVGSYGAYSADEWVNDGRWPSVRLLADGLWVRARSDGPGWEDVTQSVTEITPPDAILRRRVDEVTRS